MSYIVFTEIIQVKYLLNTFPSLRSFPQTCEHQSRRTCLAKESYMKHSFAKNTIHFLFHKSNSAIFLFCKLHDAVITLRYSGGIVWKPINTNAGLVVNEGE